MRRFAARVLWGSEAECLTRVLPACRRKARIITRGALLSFLLIGTELPAQAGRSGGTAAIVTRPVDGDSGTVAYEVGGVRVVHRIATTSDVVVANLYLLGGVRQVTRENAGIELLLLEASERGTRTYARDRLRRTMARLGTQISTSAHHDWTVIGLRATRATFDSTWKILASRVMEPRLDSADVEILRNQMLAAVRQAMSAMYAPGSGVRADAAAD